jgi:hypothetical protein
MSTEQRLAQVERQLRWHKRLGALAIAVGAVVVLVGQARDEPAHLRVRSLTMVNDQNEVRAQLHMQIGSPFLLLMDKKGRERVSLCAGAMGSTALSFMARDGKGRLAIGIGAGEVPVLYVRDSKGTGRIDMSVGADGTPSLSFLDPDGKVIWKAPGE